MLPLSTEDEEKHKKNQCIICGLPFLHKPSMQPKQHHLKMLSSLLQKCGLDINEIPSLKEINTGMSPKERLF